MNRDRNIFGAGRPTGRGRGPRTRAPGGISSRVWWILGGLLLAVIVVPSILAEMITDWMWFGSQGLADVYTTRLWLGLGVFVAAALVAAIFCLINWTVALRNSRPETLYPGQREPFSRSLARGLTVIGAILVGLFMGLVAAGEWPTILLYLNGVPFGQSDPLFGNDIGFYVFGLPFFRLLRGWAFLLLIVAAIGAGIVYLFNLMPSVGRALEEAQRRGGSIRVPRNLDVRTRAHLSILGALFLLLIAIGYWLSRFEILYSERAFAYGAGYTDYNARLPSLNIMMVVATVMAALLIVNLRVRTWRLLVGALGVWLLALILVGGLYPAIIQQFVVRPTELDLEKPYIQNNITATRAAFGLDKFQEREVPAVDAITPEQIAANRNTVENIRLWDYRPLLDTYSQLQEIRSYYSFTDVDIDRYTIGGRQRQVMLSARELSPNELGEQSRTWQNRHFVYTHGYGVVVSPVNEIEGEGLPRLLVKNIPPEASAPELRITRPEIYYGEQTGEYIFVGTSVPNQEFDYPRSSASSAEEENVYTTYQGKGGVALPNFLAKLLFAIRFGDGNIMLTEYITPQTRVLFHRNIGDAVRLLAPFLLYDRDPYIAIADGKLYWIQDAYTVTDRYPYSTPHESGWNYIRNSVKVVIDAYDGTVTFYVADATDPLVRAYRGIFPSLFRDIAAMPAAVRSHVRYPEDLMNVQAEMYGTFHMTNPQTFYTKEDVWTAPFGIQGESTQPLEAYYVNMQLPTEDREGFMLILPFTPRARDNMIAWMAAKSDGAEYGQVNVIRYPKQQLIYGPRQIEARIDQDPLISQQLTLWKQGGSTVIRGNLLTIPISNTLLYVEPLFLQATASSRFPELKRVIVATGNRVGMGSDLSAALDVAFNRRPGEVTTDGAGPPPTPVPGGTPVAGQTPSAGSAAELTQSALQHYDRAQEALRRGDWATYGREIDAMKRDLDALALLVGVPATPGATP